jgi:hypothetical protein
MALSAGAIMAHALMLVIRFLAVAVVSFAAGWFIGTVIRRLF